MNDFEKKDELMESKEYSSLTELLNDSQKENSVENQTFNSLSEIFSARRCF